MSVVILKVPSSDVSKTLELEEGHFLDVKAIEIQPSKLTRSLSAFANADGGELFIGIDEDKVAHQKSWRGFSTMEAANAHLQVIEQTFPLGDECFYEFMEAPEPSDGLVLHITVRKSRQIRNDSSGNPYIRREELKISRSMHRNC